jgi:molecular chaperone GrpE (heat shock protein)
MDANYRVPMTHHAAEIKQSEDLHKQEVKLAREHFDGDRKLSQQLYFMQTYTEFQRQAVQLDADLVNAQKEAERDMYDQRNHQLQTLVVSVTVMFAALSTVIVEGKVNCDKHSLHICCAFDAH